MKSIANTEIVKVQFETICKLYSKNNYCISLYDTEGNHISTKEDLSKLRNINLNIFESNNNLFDKDYIQPNSKEIVDREGVVKYRNQLVIDSSLNGEKENIVDIKVKLISVVNFEREICGYISIIKVYPHSINYSLQANREVEEKKKSAMVDLVMKTDESNACFFLLSDKILHVILGNNIMGIDGKSLDAVFKMMTSKTQNEAREILYKIANGELTNATLISEFIDPEDNRIRYIRNGIAPFHDEDGKIDGIIISQHDMTEDVIKTKSLKKYQINSGIVNKVAQIIYWEYDLASKLTYTRGSMLNDEIPMNKEKFLSYVHPDDQHHIITYMELMDNHVEQLDSIEIRVYMPKYKQFRWSKFYISPLWSENKIIGYTGILHDTNDERENRAHLERLNAQINQVMYMSEISPFIWKLDKNQFYFTSRYQYNDTNIILEDSEKILTYDQILSFVHPDDRKDIEDMYNKILNGEEDRGWCKLRYDEQHKFERTYIVSLVPDNTNRDSMTYIGYLQDVTTNETLTKRLIDEKLKAEESEKLKSTFLANMSHEIRTPLNAIVGFSSLIAEAETKEEQQEYSNIIRQNSDVLLQLINDVIEISTISAGRSQRRVENFNLNDLFRESYLMQRQLIQIPGVEIQLDIPEENIFVNFDKRRVIELLNNFMSNASKYTEKGHIKMGFYLVGSDHLRIYVEDTGCGIAEENREKLFIRFEKLNSFVRGAGIGMSICKHYVNEAGGKIWVESKLGEGSTFFVEMKYR